MKAIKGLLLFGISVLVTACFNPPEFGLLPTIDFEGIYFKEARTAGERDSLILTISFKDGNGDLGLSANPEDIDEPYNDVNYYLAKDGVLTPVGKETRFTDLPQFVSIPPGVTGKLVTVRTHDDPQYTSKVPAFTDPYSCTFFTYTSVYIDAADADIFDGTYSLDTILSRIPGVPEVYVLLDTFYYQRNPNYANIDVDFYTKDGSGYTFYDWEKEFCTVSFNQRFPVLAENEGPLEGSLQYSIVTTGLKNIFSIKTLNLKIKIRDRALNVSNIVETGDFTLDKIKR